MTILNNIFRNSQNETWDKLCEELGGTITKATFYDKEKIKINVDEWTITLDSYAAPHGTHDTKLYTRIRAPYINRDGFRFKLYKENVFSSIGKVLGLQDVVVGHEPFDQTFIIKANDETKVKRLFNCEEIRKLLLEHQDIHFEVKEDEGTFGAEFPDGVDELYFETDSIINDTEWLKHIFDLFSEVLHRLCHMGSAYEEDPHVNL